MGQQYSELSEEHVGFIAEQKMYLVATATDTSRINLSPKGQDSFRVINSKQVAWLNVTGSGNETSAHVQVDKRMTIMFCAFEGKPVILRIYGKAQEIHQNDPSWKEYYSLFPPLPGARQIFLVDVELVQKSCGMSVPFFEYLGEREQLNDWAVKKGSAGIAEYWQQKNQFSIDNIPTNIVSKNL